MSNSSDDTRELYERVAAQLERDGAERGVMFGMPSLKVGEKAIGGYAGGEMVFKLRGADHGRALALPGARLFDPSGRGRPMKEWVQVPYEHHDEWLELGGAAIRVAADR